MTDFSSRWQRFRELMPITRHLAYLDHAATAPISGPANDAIGAWAQQASEWGDTAWPEWEQRANRVRRAAAEDAPVRHERRRVLYRNGVQMPVEHQAPASPAATSAFAAAFTAPISSRERRGGPLRPS